MKNIIKYSFLLLTGMVLLNSCKKKVDDLPSDVILPEFAFTNVTDLQNGLNSAYARYDGENTSYINAILSDETLLGRDWAGQGQFANRFQYGSDATTGSDVTQGWRTFYSMTQACNLVLDNLDKVIVTTSADTAKKLAIKAQALALRALSFFELQERYAKAPYDPSAPGIPLVLNYIDPVLAPKPPRATSGEVLTKIQSDLTTASGLLPAATAANFTDVAMNRLNITGLQARVALYKGEWQKAIDSSTFVINSGIRPLDPVGFPGIWTDASLTSEVLYRTKRNTSGSSVDVLYLTATNALYFSPSTKLRGLYAAGDVRIGSYFATFVTGVPNQYVVFKYYQSATLGGRVNDLKGMRISEMYLIRAEAAVELTGTPTAGSADLTTLRTARSAGTVPVFATKAAAISFILDERARELAFEGFRFFDLKRKGMSIDRNLADVQSPAWQTLPAGDYHFALPIPVAETQANPNVAQNPNY